MRWTPIPLVGLALFGCQPGQVSDSTPAPPDAGTAPGFPDAGPESDAPLADPTYSLSGVVRDYEGSDPLPRVDVATEGLALTLATQSDDAGAYVLAGIPAASVLFLHAMPSGTLYRPTLNPVVAIGEADVQEDVQVLSSVHAQRLYATINLAPQPGTAVVIAELRQAGGAPLEGIPPESITLTAAGGADRVGKGPYFLNGTNDIDPTLTATTAFGGRARVAYLDVPPGEHSLVVVVEAGPPPVTAQARILTWQNGATLARVVHEVASPPGTPTFDRDVYPLLARASQGGQGCANCHTAGGAAGAILVLDDGVANVFARLTGNPLYVDKTTPKNSLLLTKPLYESPPNHPNATWLDTNAPAYQTILAWITAGAPFGGP